MKTLCVQVSLHKHCCCCSVTKLCLTLCNPMDCSMPSFPVISYLLEFAKAEKAMAPRSNTLAWKIHGQRSLVGCGTGCCEESDTTERLPFHFSLSCIGEGNGNPIQCFCLENPRDGEACWAAVYGVTQSRT